MHVSKDWVSKVAMTKWGQLPYLHDSTCYCQLIVFMR